MDAESTILAVVCLVTSFIAFLIYRKSAEKLNILAHPTNRGAHLQPTPTGAGIVMVVVYLAAALMPFTKVPEIFWPVIVGPVAVATVGWMDDIRPLAPAIRLPLYLAAAAWCCYWLGFPPLNLFGLVVDLGMVGLVLGTLSLFWLQNLYNFMDGIDGIAALEAVTVCLGALLIGGGDLTENWQPMTLVLLVVTASFLVLNRPVARLFMGDAGSSFIGLLLGVIILSGDILTMWAWLILLAFFISDATVTIFIRLIHGEDVLSAHSQHAYQHLGRRYGVTRVLLAMSGINLLWLLPLARLADQSPDTGLGWLLLAYLPLIVGLYLAGSGKPMLAYRE